MSPSNVGQQGQQFAEDSSSPFNAYAFIVRAMLSKVCTSMPVEVIACTNNGGVEQTGFVDLQPLIDQVDGDGNAVPHAVIFRCPYSRIQGGANALIIDPVVGDKGIAVFASRDISKFVATQDKASPGSRRQHGMTDAMYIGVSMLNVDPAQYIQMSDEGITIVSPTRVALSAQDIVLTAPTIELNASDSLVVTAAAGTFNGLMTFTGPVSMAQTLAVAGTLTQAGKNVGSTHTHTGVKSGGDESGAVT